MLCLGIVPKAGFLGLEGAHPAISRPTTVRVAAVSMFDLDGAMTLFTYVCGKQTGKKNKKKLQINGYNLEISCLELLSPIGATSSS